MQPKDAKEIASQIKKLITVDAIKIIGIEAKKHFQESFETANQGFTDESLEKWKELKESSKKRKTRANGSTPGILTDKGHLRDSINWEGDFNKGEVIMSSDKPYAQIHNQGGTISGTASVKAHTRNGKNVKAHTRKVNITIPKRQFMGPSKKLNEKILAKIDRQIKKILDS